MLPASLARRSTVMSDEQLELSAKTTRNDALTNDKDRMVGLKTWRGWSVRFFRRREMESKS
jgi:hypothetical protein